MLRWMRVQVWSPWSHMRECPVNLTLIIGWFPFRGLSPRFNILPVCSSMQTSALPCSCLNLGRGRGWPASIAHPSLLCQQDSSWISPGAGERRAARGWLLSLTPSFVSIITSMSSPGPAGPQRPLVLASSWSPLPVVFAIYLFPLSLSEGPHTPLSGFSALPSHSCIKFPGFDTPRLTSFSFLDLEMYDTVLLLLF